jgi:hypothetical protein
MSIAKLTKEQLETYAKESNNWKELMDKCGYTNHGCRYYLNKKLYMNDISISHFVKKAPTKRYTDEEIFKENSEYTSMKPIKNKLINKYKWKYECNICKITKWNDKQITLDIDHINGNHSDNRIENLRFLCPNCHSQTDTYKGRNLKNKEHSKKLYENIKLKEICPNCKNKKHKYSEYCKKCHFVIKMNRQPKDESEKKNENKYHRKLKKCISCDNQIQLDCERCKDCYTKARKEKLPYEKEAKNSNNRKPCPDCNKSISIKSLRCRLCNYKVLKSKSEVKEKERIKKQCVDCSTQIVYRAIRCVPCSNTIVEKANSRISNKCIDCQKEIWDTATRCVECHLINARKVTRPTYEEIMKDRETMTMIDIGKKYGVSDNAVRKWIKQYKSKMHKAKPLE